MCTYSVVATCSPNLLLLSWMGSEPVCGIIELFELEGALKCHLVQHPCSEQGDLQLDQVLRSRSRLTLNVSGDGAPITSLGNLFPVHHL